MGQSTCPSLITPSSYLGGERGYTGYGQRRRTAFTWAGFYHRSWRKQGLKKECIRGPGVALGAAMLPPFPLPPRTTAPLSPAIC